MNTNDPGKGIAQRTFRFEGPDGDSEEVVVSVCEPREMPAGEWGCPIVITAADGTTLCSDLIFGEDSLQALILALRILGPILHSLRPKVEILLDDQEDLHLWPEPATTPKTT